MWRLCGRQADNLLSSLHVHLWLYGLSFFLDKITEHFYGQHKKRNSREVVGMLLGISLIKFNSGNEEHQHYVTSHFFQHNLEYGQGSRIHLHVHRRFADVKAQDISAFFLCRIAGFLRLEFLPQRS